MGRKKQAKHFFSDLKHKEMGGGGVGAGCGGGNDGKAANGY